MGGRLGTCRGSLALLAHLAGQHPVESGVLSFGADEHGDHETGRLLLSQRVQRPGRVLAEGVVTRIRVNGDPFAIVGRFQERLKALPVDGGAPIRQAQEEDLVVEEAMDPPSEARKIKPFKRLKDVDVDRILSEMRADRL